MKKTTEIPLENGTGRIWESRPGTWSWAHNDGSEGESKSFCDSLTELNQIDRETALIAKINTRYPREKFTALANTGDFEAAAEAAAGVVWGIWIDLRRAAGLPYDNQARQDWITAHTARTAKGKL